MSNEIILHQQNGRVLVTSREVAEKFGKEHKNVIQAVKNLTAENSALLPMFIESSYKTVQNKELPMYYMDRDGFTLLVMGFTGKEALNWKVKYIQAFNQMEEQLKAKEIQSAMPACDARMMEAEARLTNSRVDAAKLLLKLGDKAALQYQREHIYACALHTVLGTATPQDPLNSINTTLYLKD